MFVVTGCPLFYSLLGVDRFMCNLLCSITRLTIHLLLGGQGGHWVTNWEQTQGLRRMEVSNNQHQELSLHLKTDV